MTRARNTAVGDTPFADRVDAVPWNDVGAELERYGCALTGPLLSPQECAAIAALYPDDSRFRSTVNMGRYRFGEGEYRYFAEPFSRRGGRAQAGPVPAAAADRPGLVDEAET